VGPEEEQSKGSGELAEATPAKLSASKPFILSEGLPPVPHKLAARILQGEFVDMAELLCDNLEVERRASSTKQSPTPSSAAPKPRREIPDLLSWVQCFGTYMVVVTSKFPHRTKELAYQTLIVREARRCGGKGWLTYDSYFRQQGGGERLGRLVTSQPVSLCCDFHNTRGSREREKLCAMPGE
jgi:hypothetical protein